MEHERATLLRPEPQDRASQVVELPIALRDAVGVAAELFFANRGSTPRCGGLVVVAALGLLVGRGHSPVVLRRHRRRASR